MVRREGRSRVQAYKIGVHWVKKKIGNFRKFIEAIVEVASPQEVLEQARNYDPDLPDEVVNSIVEQALERKRKQDLEQKLIEGRFTAAELEEVELPKLRFVIERILSAGLMILAGKPKIGKSWLVLAIAIAISIGSRVFGYLEATVGDVLYIALEDGPRRLKDRIKKILQGTSAPSNLHFATEWPRLDSGGLAQLDGWLKSHPKTCLVIIDTFIRVRRLPKHGRHNVYQEDYEALRGLHELANSFGVAIIAVQHTRKAEASDFIDSVSGTAGITGAADTVWVLNRGRGRSDAILTITGRDIKEDDLALNFDKSIMNWRLVGQASDYTRTLARQEIIDVLKKSGQPLGPKKVAGSLKKNYNAVKKLMSEMAKAGDLAKPDRGQYTLPSHHSDDSNLTHHGYLGDEEKVVSLSSCV
jgi:hypothetical protein